MSLYLQKRSLPEGVRNSSKYRLGGRGRTERCLLAEGTDRNGSNPQSQKTAYGPSPVEPRVTQDPYRKAGPFKRNLGQGKGSPGKAFLGAGPARSWAFLNSPWLQLGADYSIKEAGHEHCGHQLDVGQRTLSRLPMWRTGRTKEPQDFRAHPGAFGREIAGLAAGFSRVWTGGSLPAIFAHLSHRWSMALRSTAPRSAAR